MFIETSSLPFALLGKKIKSVMKNIAIRVIFNYGNDKKKRIKALCDRF